MTHSTDHSSCPLCGTPAGAGGSLWQKGGRRIVRCPDCRFLFADPLESDTAVYDQDYYEQGDHVDSPDRAAIFRRRYEDLIVPSGRVGCVLDIGCGTGDFLVECKEQGWTTVGVDVSAFAVETTARRTGGDVHRGKLEELPLQDRSFDLIHMHHVLEHIADPQAFLRTVAKLLKPGGRLIVEVPNERNFIYYAMRLQRKAILPSDIPPSHLLFFDPQSLRHMLELSGYELLQMKQEDWTTPERRRIYRYFDGRGNLVSRLVESAHRSGLPARMGLGLFLIAVARPLVSREGSP